LNSNVELNIQTNNGYCDTRTIGNTNNSLT